MKQDAQGMNFEVYAERIINLRKYQQESKTPKKIIQRRFQIKNTEIWIIPTEKSQFPGLSDKRYYFLDGKSVFRTSKRKKEKI